MLTRKICLTIMSSSIEKKISTIHFSSVSLSAVHIRDFHIFQLFIHHLTGFIWNQHKDQLPVGMLAQSLGRALHRYRRGHGSKSRTSRQYFSGPVFTAAQVVFITAKVAFIFTFLSAVHICDFHIFKVINHYDYEIPRVPILCS